MLSRLGKCESELFMLVGIGRYLKRRIHPSPKIPMRKEIKAQKSHEIRERPGEPGTQLQVAQQQHGDQCCPNLSLDGVGAGSHEGLDLEVLFESLEEQLNLPAILVDGCDRRRCQVHMIGEKDQGPVLVGVVELDPPQQMRTLLLGGLAGEADDLVLENVPALRHHPSMNNLVSGSLFHPRYKVNSLRGPLSEEPEIVVAPVIDDDRAGLNMQGLSHADIGHLPFGYYGERGQISVMVQKQVQLDGPLGLPELGPIEGAQAHVDYRGVQAHESVLETKFLAPPGDLSLASRQQTHEDPLVQLPGPMVVGIGQGRLVRSSDPQVLQLPLTTSQPTGYLSQGVRPAKLAKQHAHELCPRGKPSGVTFRLNFLDFILELQPRKQLKDLAEHATESIHKAPPWCGWLFSPKNQPILPEVGPFCITI
jgi:hypothetical protein